MHAPKVLRSFGKRCRTKGLDHVDDQEPMADKRSSCYNNQTWWLFGKVFVRARDLETFTRLGETLDITMKLAQATKGGRVCP